MLLGFGTKDGATISAGANVAARSGSLTAEGRTDASGVVRLELPLHGSITVFVDDIAVSGATVDR